jgi:hypothetical protein
MLTQTEIERERYEARRKAQLDYNSGMNFARRQGEMAGEKIGAIHICERMLQRPETPKEQLLTLSTEDLNRLAEDLEKQAFKKR